MTVKNKTNSSLLNDSALSTSGYGTFPETSSATISLQKSLSKAQKNHSQLECGQKCLINPVNGCTLGKVVPFPTTLVVKNSGSTARDNCAIERNFLSWLRLSVSLVLVGMANYFHLRIITPELPENEGNENDNYENNFSTLLGLFFMSLGIFLLTWASFNYFQFQQMLADRCAIVQHEIIHFLVAGFVGFTIFTTFIFNILRDHDDNGLGKNSIKSIFTWWG